MTTRPLIRRIWRAELFGLGFRSDQLDALIALRERYEDERMFDGKRP